MHASHESQSCIPVLLPRIIEKAPAPPTLLRTEGHARDGRDEPDLGVVADPSPRLLASSPSRSPSFRGRSSSACRPRGNGSTNRDSVPFSNCRRAGTSYSPLEPTVRVRPRLSTGEADAELAPPLECHLLHGHQLPLPSIGDGDQHRRQALGRCFPHTACVHRIANGRARA